MGRGRTKKTKKKDKAWSNGKRKFKAQDPIYRGLDVRQMAHHSKKERCRAPKGDKDANDIPPIFGSMFGGGKEDLPASSSPLPATATPAEPKSKKARRRERTSAEAGAKLHRNGAALADVDIRNAALPKEVQDDKTSASALPKQRPLETVAEYSRRLQQAVKSKLQVVQKKANTDHQKERQKERARALKDKRRAKAEKKASLGQSATATSTATAAKFGEVVQRPPSFSKDTLKSLSKGQAVKSSAANLSDYASQVRNAYEEMKKKRREKAEAAQVAAGKK